MTRHRRHSISCSTLLASLNMIWAVIKMFEHICGNCKFYENVQGKRQGYCRNPKSYYYDLKRQRSNKGADRCFKKEKKK